MFPASYFSPSYFAASYFSEGDEVAAGHFPIAHFPDAHFPDAHFPHGDAPPESDGEILLFFGELLNIFDQEEVEQMYRIFPPKNVTKSDTVTDNAVLSDHSNPELVWVDTVGSVTLFTPLSDGGISEVLYPATVAGGWLLVAPFTGVKSTGTTATVILSSRRF